MHGRVPAAALACGLVIDTMLWINNFRDREEDARCGKKTLVAPKQTLSSSPWSMRTILRHVASSSGR